MAITYRTTPKPGDLGQMIYLHGILYDYGKEFEYYVADTLTNFFRHYNPERERLWVAEAEGQIVGTLVLKDTNGWAHLRYFLIRPEYRGRGIGKHLLRQFMEFFEACGYQKSFLLTSDGLDAAVHLYEGYGYQRVDSRIMDFGLREHRFELHR